MRAIDTNVLVRLLARDDEQQTAAAEHFVHGGAWVSLAALAETVWVLAAVYAFRPAKIAAAVEMLLDHDQLSLQDPEAVASALERFRQIPSLGFSDCLQVELARKSGHLPFGTFDRKLAKVPGTQQL